MAPKRKVVSVKKVVKESTVEVALLETNDSQIDQNQCLDEFTTTTTTTTTSKAREVEGDEEQVKTVVPVEDKSQAKPKPKPKTKAIDREEPKEASTATPGGEIQEKGEPKKTKTKPKPKLKRKGKKRRGPKSRLDQIQGGSGREEYKRYVFRVMKQVHPGMAISAKAMTVINNMMNDMFERLADEAAKLLAYTKRATLTSREVQAAVRLVLPGDLGRHAIAEGAKAVTNYMSINRVEEVEEHGKAKSQGKTS